MRPWKHPPIEEGHKVPCLSWVFSPPSRLIGCDLWEIFIFYNAYCQNLAHEHGHVEDTLVSFCSGIDFTS